MKPPFNLSDFEPRMDAVPALGGATDAILAELGYDPAAVKALRASGVI
jgi:crotonobetainyl-CoA:carnitine CoA-transferase CaiB-like acyl-CoA transferase